MRAIAVVLAALALASAALVGAVPTRSYANCVALYQTATIDYRLYWSVAGANINIALDATGVGANTWASIAVSPGGTMDDADYALGYLVGTTSVVRDLYNPAGAGHVQPGDDAVDSLTNKLVSQVGTTVTVEYTRTLAAGVAPQDKPIATAGLTSIIWGYSPAGGAGAAATGAFQRHANRGATSVNFGLAASNCTAYVAGGATGGATGNGGTDSGAAGSGPGSFCDGGFCLYFVVDETRSLVNFSVRASASSYAAFGLTDTAGSMVPADMYVTWVAANGQPFVSDRFASSRSEPATDAVQNVLAVSGSATASGLSVDFSRPLVTGDPSDRDITDTSMNFIWATLDGGVPAASVSASIGRHSATGSGTINFFTGAVTRDKSKRPLKSVHGVLMVIAWVFLVPSGTLVARYFKNELGVWWFRIHVGAQSLAALLTFVSFWLAIAAVPPGPHFKDENVGHKGLGLFVFIATLLQVLVGVLADRLWSPTRLAVPVFPDIVHWIAGYVLAFVAFVNVCLGFKAFVSPAWVYAVSILVWVAFFVAHIALHFVKGQSHHKEPPAQVDLGGAGPAPAPARAAAAPSAAYANGRPQPSAGSSAARAPPPAPGAAPAPAPPGTRRVNESVTALYDFTGENADELSFREGDVIAVSLVHDDGWATGTLKGRAGVFPYEYTKVNAPPVVARSAVVGRPGPPPPGASAARPAAAGRPGPPPPGAAAAAPVSRFAPGQAVSALFPGDGNYYPATVSRVQGASVVVVFTGYEPEEVSVPQAQVRV